MHIRVETCNHVDKIIGSLQHRKLHFASAWPKFKLVKGFLDQSWAPGFTTRRLPPLRVSHTALTSATLAWTRIRECGVRARSSNFITFGPSRVQELIVHIIRRMLFNRKG